MKEISELSFNESVKYSKEHTWVRVEGDLVKLGISDYAQDQLGEIIFIELPHEGENFDQDQMFGFVESVKTASELYMPVSGTIIEVNAELANAPEMVNTHPFDSGWMIKITPADAGQIDGLMNVQAYLKELGHEII